LEGTLLYPNIWIGAHVLFLDVQDQCFLGGGIQDGLRHYFLLFWVYLTKQNGEMRIKKSMFEFVIHF